MSIERMRVRGWLSAAVLCLCCASSATVRAQVGTAAPRVAVVVQVKVNVDDREASRLVAGLEQAIGRQFEVDIAPQDVVTERAQDPAPDCLAQTQCVQGLIGRLKVDHVLSIVIVRMADDYQIATTWIDGRSGGLIERPQLKIPATTPDLVAAFVPHVARLLPDLNNRDIAPPPAKTAQPSRTPMWIAGGVAAAALLTGATLGVMAWRDYSACKDMPCRYRETQSLDGKQLGADIAFSVAIAAGGVATWLYFRSDTSEAEPSLGAVVTGDRGVLVYSGSF